MLNINPRLAQSILSLKVNYIIKILIFSYVFVLAGWGLITPILAVFITDKIPGATIETVGFAISIYALTRSIIQLPIARILDMRRGEKDEFIALFIGFIIVGISAFAYIGVTSAFMLYIVQIIYGIGDGLIYPSWGSLFASHLDKDSKATETSMYQTSADLTSAISASLGALLVAKFGYAPVFMLVGVSTFIGAATMIPMYWELKK